MTSPGGAAPERAGREAADDPSCVECHADIAEPCATGCTGGEVDAASWEALSDLCLSYLKPPKFSGGSWTLNPDALAAAIVRAGWRPSVLHGPPECDCGYLNGPHRTCCSIWDGDPPPRLPAADPDAAVTP